MGETMTLQDKNTCYDGIVTKLKHEVEQSTLQLFQHKIDEYHSRADMLIEQHRIESRIYVQEEDNIYIEEKENFQD